MTPGTDPLQAAAALLAAQDSRGWQKLQTEHRADAGGHCRACRQAASGLRRVWPCRLATIAELAEQLSVAARRKSGRDGSANRAATLA